MIDLDAQFRHFSPVFQAFSAEREHRYCARGLTTERKCKVEQAKDIFRDQGERLNCTWQRTQNPTHTTDLYSDDTTLPTPVSFIVDQVS